MFCVNCGKEVNDNFCTACGTPVNGGVSSFGQCNLEISRPDAFWGFAAKLNVTVDGNVYTLYAGQKININIAPGLHEVKYKIWCRREQRVTVSAMAGGNYSVIFVYDWLWGGFKVSPTSKLQ